MRLPFANGEPRDFSGFLKNFVGQPVIVRANERRPVARGDPLRVPLARRLSGHLQLFAQRGFTNPLHDLPGCEHDLHANQGREINSRQQDYYSRDLCISLCNTCAVTDTQGVRE